MVTTKLPIVQGSCYKDLRQQSAEYIANSNQVNAMVDFLLESLPKMYAMTEVVCEFFLRINRAI
jgi:queuine tRNA-ribosyltransferase